MSGRLLCLTACRDSLLAHNEYESRVWAFYGRWQVSILRGLKERYEVHHGVRLQDAALISAAQLSHRYIADRFLPDKAIDLVDEAAAKLNIEASGTPNRLCLHMTY